MGGSFWKSAKRKRMPWARCCAERGSSPRPSGGIWPEGRAWLWQGGDRERSIHRVAQQKNAWKTAMFGLGSLQDRTIRPLALGKRAAGCNGNKSGFSRLSIERLSGLS